MSRLQRRKSSERGAVLVEAVLILPVVLLLVMGIIEFGFMFKAEGTIANASSRAGRAIASSPKNPDQLEKALDITRRNATVLNQGEPYRLIIYRVVTNPDPATGAAGTGKLPGNLTSDKDNWSDIWDYCTTGSGAGEEYRVNCNAYEWNTTTPDDWSEPRGVELWDPLDQSACAPFQESTGSAGQRDYVAVMMVAKYTPMTDLIGAFVGDPKFLSSRAIYELEPFVDPLGITRCKSNHAYHL